MKKKSLPVKKMSPKPTTLNFDIQPEEDDLELPF